MTNETRVVKAIQSVLDKRPELTLESRLQDDLQVDSLEKLMIISALEDEFSMTIADDHFTEVETVKDIVIKLRESGLVEGDYEFR